MTAAVFLDRDGTVVVDLGYLRDPDDVRLLDGAAVGLRAMQDAGLPLIVVSNQSGIGRGLISTCDAEAVHDRFVSLLAEDGIELAGTYYCPHVPGNDCPCRKPSIGMFTKAAEDLEIDLTDAVMVGDRLSDISAGHAAGCRTILLADVPSEHLEVWRTTRDLRSAAVEILKEGE